MKWALIIVGGVVVLVAIVWVIGTALPQGHIATRVARYKQPPEKVWEAITNVEAMPSWRKDVKSVKRLPDENGRAGWVETSSDGEIPLRVEEADAPRRMVTRITDPKLPFGGTWTFEIAAVDGGSTLRITEAGEVYPPLFRFMARFIFGHGETMENYLKNLGAKFGETVEPQG